MLGNFGRFPRQNPPFLAGLVEGGGRRVFYAETGRYIPVFCPEKQTENQLERRYNKSVAR